MSSWATWKRKLLPILSIVSHINYAVIYKANPAFAPTPPPAETNLLHIDIPSQHPNPGLFGPHSPTAEIGASIPSASPTPDNLLLSESDVDQIY